MIMNNFPTLSALLKKIIEIGPTGCACMITKQGEPVFEEYCGFADREHTRPVSSDTVYRIYSMTKVITCTAALMLYERGAYLLGDPLKEYLPEFSDMQICSYDMAGTLTIRSAKDHILIRDLFCMTSGLTYYGDLSETEKHIKMFNQMIRENKCSLRDSMHELARIPLAFEPGSHWKYGLSHDVLGALIEVLSGKTFGQFLKDEIFDLLGMKDTAFHIREDIKPRLAGIYTHNPDGTFSDYEGSGHEHFEPDDPFESGGAGLLSTLGDYMKFARVLACGGEKDGVRLLGRKTLELMALNHLSPQQLEDYHEIPQRAGYGYGLGVRVLMDKAANGCNATIGEFGWGGLPGTQLMIDSKEELAMVFMQQLWPNMGEYIHPRLRAVINAAL